MTTAKRLILSMMVLAGVYLNVTLQAQSVISSFTTSATGGNNSDFSRTSPSDAGNDIVDNQAYLLQYGRGNDLFVTDYTVSGTTYDRFLRPDTLILNRRTPSDRLVNIWYTLITDPAGNTTLQLDPTAAEDADAIYLTGTVNAGYDNILVNDDDLASGSIQVETERVDVIWYQGIQTSTPGEAVFPVIERGGNDNIAIAAITSLNPDGTPASYGTLIGIPETLWPQAGSSFNNYLILRRETAGVEPIPLLNIGTFVPQSAQIVQGVAASFTELGISANQSVFGYSLFSADVCSGFITDTGDVLTTGAQTIAGSIDLTDISTFPSDTKSNDSGLDLVAGLSAAVASNDNLIETKGPGGYKAALATWLKANESDDVTTSTEGSTVTDWQDHWLGNNDFTTGIAGAAPTYRSTSTPINFNPTVDFTSSSTSLSTANNDAFNDTQPYTNKGINIAFRTSTSNITTRQVLFEQGGNTRGINIYLRDGDVHVTSWNRSNDGAGSPWNDTGNVSTVSAPVSTNTEYIVTLEQNGNSTTTGTLTAYLNGQSIGVLPNIGLLYRHTGGIELGGNDGNTRFDDGSNNGVNSFFGEISEFIYCNEPGSFVLSQRQRIESYLAIKYGITLDQSTPVNYVNSDGDIIFDATNNASLGGFLEYNNDIAGIGRDDASELDQPESRSENTGSVVTIDRGATISTDDSWLIWGNDGAALTENPALTKPDTIENRLTRVWRASETNEVLTTSVSFDLTGLGLGTDPSDFSLLIAGNSSNADFSSAEVISGGTYDAPSNTITFTGVDIDDGEYFTLGTQYFQCGPGGVFENLSLWLRADLGTNTSSEGAEVTTWNDQTGSNNATGSGGTSPTFDEVDINFNPSLNFDGATELLNGTAGFSSIGYFLVLRPDNTINPSTSGRTSQVPLGFDDQSVTPTNNLAGFYLGSLYQANEIVGHNIGNGTISYVRAEINASKTIDANIPLMFEVRSNAGTTNSEIYQNGIQVDNTSGAGAFLEVTDEEYTLGRFETNDFGINDGFDGKIAEVISYDVRPTDTEKNRIQSYLAVKYGITLDQTSATDYLAADGGTIWSATDNSSYNNDIAGIGRDDLSCLNQLQSRSENSGSIVSMGLGEIAATNAANPNSFASDDSFLVWGNDGASANEANTVAYAEGVVTERMLRIWRADENAGTVGATDISFDLTGLGYTGNLSDYSLIISDASGLTSPTILTASSFTSDVVTFNNVDLTDGQYFTLGTARSTCGPGGVNTDLELWLRADYDVFNTGTTPANDGQTVSGWGDQSASIADASDPSNLTVFQTNTANFNPAVEFDNDATSLEGSFTTTTAGLTQFTAGFWSSSNATNDALYEFFGGSATNRGFLGGSRYGGTNAFGTALTADAWSIWTVDHPSGTTADIYENGMVINSSYSTSLYNAGAGSYTYYLGDDQTSGEQFTGFLGDVIAFQGTLTATERDQVETYLAIKYGITIDQTSATNYLWSDGSTVLWNATTNSLYNNDIAGIGKDDNSCFSQKQSTSINTDDILTIGLGAVANSNIENANGFDDNGDYLIWGNDNGSTLVGNANTSDVPGIVTERMERIWKVQDTGNVGDTELQFDLSGTSFPTGDASAYTLLVGNTATMADATIITGGTFNGSVLSFSGIDLTDGQFFTIGTAVATCGPGGVNTNIALWLRADEEVFSDAGVTTAIDGNDVGQWNDQSSPADNGSESNLGGGGVIEPTFQTNEINFNPVLRFTDPNSTNASYIETGANSVSGDMTLISVFQTGQSDGTANDFENSPALIGASETGSTLDYGLGMENGSIWMNANTTTTFDVETGTTFNNNRPHFVTATRTQSSGAITIFVDANSEATGTGSTSTLTGPTSFGIGNHSDGDIQAQYAGDIAETIVFSSALTSDERNRVESYLGLKYGITMNAADDGTTGGVDERDYRAADGGVIWDYDGQTPTYYNDIFGIGRDDLSCFEQTQAKSENSDALVTFNQSGSFTNDDSFLVSGNDNAAVEQEGNTERPSGINSRLNREWRVQETGTVGSIELTYDMSTITGPLGVGTNNLGQLRLMVDDDGDFTSGVTLLSPSSFNGSENTVTFTVDFTSGQYYTLGSEEKAALPVELLSFEANAKDEIVDLNWSTVSEINNAFFTVERSANGMDFESLANIDGAGTSQGVIRYHYADRNPLDGFSFYRLRQTDFSGEYDYSEVQSVYVERSKEIKISLFPNPIRIGETLKMSHNLLEPQSAIIQIFDLNGRVSLKREIALDPAKAMIEIETNSMSRGINVIKLILQNGESFTFRILLKN